MINTKFKTVALPTPGNRSNERVLLLTRALAAVSTIIVVLGASVWCGSNVFHIHVLEELYVGMKPLQAVLYAVLLVGLLITSAFLHKAVQDRKRALDDVLSLNQELNKQLDQLVASYEQINAALQARSEFLARVSHELRTPLGGIISTTEMLLRTNLNLDQAELAQIALDSGGHLLGLINDVLDFSKIEAKKLTIEKIDVDLYGLVASVVECLRTKAERKGLVVLTGASPEVPRLIKADPVRLRQVLTNLLDNAIKFTHVGEVVLLVGVGAGERATLNFSIKDSGIGISRENIERLFQPFVQADGSMTRRYGGSGLGLSICKSLVELMGGSIRVMSKPGVGSEFCFSLPMELASDSLSTRKTASHLQAITTTTKSTVILVVEDSPVNAKIAVLQLNKLGYRVELARNGREAVDAVSSKDYALVFMDVQMPEMDGLEATKRIRLREISTKGHVPIVALTAHAMVSDREKCLMAGMDDYVCKPPSLETLAKVIKQWIPGQGSFSQQDTTTVDLEQVPESRQQRIGVRQICKTLIDG